MDNAQSRVITKTTCGMLTFHRGVLALEDRDFIANERRLRILGPKSDLVPEALDRVVYHVAGKLEVSLRHWVVSLLAGFNVFEHPGTYIPGPPLSLFC